MKALTQRQAQRCEEAHTKRCRCRCHGAAHGAQRGNVLDLDAGDVHHAEEPKRRRREPVIVEVLALPFLAFVLLVGAASRVEADEQPIDPPAAVIETPVEPTPVAPDGSRCPELYPVVVEHWPNAALHWPVLDKILWRESRCNPYVVNRYGCVGLMQVCRVNHRRLGVSRADLLDPGTNIDIGYTLCLEQIRRHRSCWRPWWVGRFRP